MSQSTEHFTEMLERCIRHFNVLNENYDVFRSEFHKIRNLIKNSNSQFLKKKFSFLLPSENKINSEKEEKSFQIDDYIEKFIKSMKMITIIGIHLSNN